MCTLSPHIRMYNVFFAADCKREECTHAFFGADWKGYECTLVVGKQTAKVKNVHLLLGLRL